MIVTRLPMAAIFITSAVPSDLQGFLVSFQSAVSTYLIQAGDAGTILNPAASIDSSGGLTRVNVSFTLSFNSKSNKTDIQTTTAE